MKHPERRTVLKGLACATGALALPACTTTPAPMPLRKGETAAALSQLTAWIDAQMRSHDGANMSVALLDGDKVIWSGAWGMADPARRIPATGFTRYRAGSISKVFTALAAMQLAEQGRLDLDAPLVDVLPGFNMRSRFPWRRQLTPRRILCHRAGLPCDLMQGMWTDEPVDLEGLVALLAQEYMAFEPGELYAYSNIAFSLLGAAMQRIVGQPFAQWMRHAVLDPLGMADSSFELKPPFGEKAALGLGENGRPAHEPALRDIPAGGLNTTVIDLLQLGRMWWSGGMLQGRRIVSGKALHEMQRPQSAPTPLDTATVGLGWHLLESELEGLGPLLWHAGGTVHHHAELMLLPSQRLGVAVMSSSSSAAQLAHDTALKALSLLATTRTGVDPVAPLRTGVDPAYPPALALDYPGYYDSPLGVIRIIDEGDSPKVEALGKRLHLVADADGYRHFQYRLLGLLPISLGKIGEMAFTRHDPSAAERWLLARRRGRFVVGGIRLDPVVIPAAWQARVGRYRYAGDDPFLSGKVEQVSLMLEGGLLLIHAELDEGILRMALAPLGDEEAVIRGRARGRGETLFARVEASGTVLHYSGMRFVACDGQRA